MKRRARRILSGGCLAVAMLWGGAPAAPAAEPVARAEAESFTVVRGVGGAYVQRSAVKGRALVLRAGAEARRTLHTEAADELVVRVRRGVCAKVPRVLVRVDGRAVLDARLPLAAWTELRSRIALATGDHELAVAVERSRRSRGCRVDARIDRIVVVPAVGPNAESLHASQGKTRVPRAAWPRSELCVPVAGEGVFKAGPAPAPPLGTPNSASQDPVV